MYIDDTSFEVVEMRRVIKISQSANEVERSVARLNVSDEKERLIKIGQLMAHGMISTAEAINLAVRHLPLDLLFGQPRLVDFHPGPFGTGENPHIAYTQDFTTPVGDILSTLNTDNDYDLRIGCQIIDDYVSAQLLLCSYGLYDPAFKLTDNCAQSIPLVFEDSFSNFRMIDLGELSSRLPALLELIREKKWEKIIHNVEYTQLPPALQEYFNAAHEQRFTIDTVTQLWCANLQGASESETDTIGFTLATMDREVPSKVAVLLRERGETK
jgi:hypothetical protein